MSAPTSQEEIEAYKRARVEAYEREQRENAELLRQRKEAEEARLKKLEPVAGSSGDEISPSIKKQQRTAKAKNRRTLDPSKMEELKKLRNQQAQAIGAGGGTIAAMGTAVLPPCYFPHVVASNSQECVFQTRVANFFCNAFF